MMSIDFTVWGSVHLVVGAAVLLPGVVLLRHDPPGWARFNGMLVVGLCIIVQLVWLPAQPIWSILMVVLGVVVLRALVLTWDDE
ncbi:hypothetical protein PHK61_24710 [Actinomycetospora lutea]|nr:hypothetical protein [Actinomycetospora lutea]MDD7941628.1 hypothetical protein [Actinomycetospora lutea]